MRNLLAFLAAVVLTVAGVGWYLGWYSVQSAPATGGHRTVNIDIDGTKIGEDLQKGEHKLQQAIDGNSKSDAGTRADGTKLDPARAGSH